MIDLPIIILIYWQLDQIAFIDYFVFFSFGTFGLLAENFSMYYIQKKVKHYYGNVSKMWSINFILFFKLAHSALQ